MYPTISVKVPEKAIKRSFVPETLEINVWEDIKPYFVSLLNREINSANELEYWLVHKSELEAILEENMAWRYIKRACNTGSEEFNKSYNYFINNIQPQTTDYSNKFDHKLLNSEYVNCLEKLPRYEIYLRSVRKKVAIFKTENIAIYTKIFAEQQKFGNCVSNMTVSILGNEYTLPRASEFLRNPDRKLREEVFIKIKERRNRDKDYLHELYTTLISFRNEIGINAGFSNFRDYMFSYLYRFDYTPEDCYDYHDSISSEIVPLTRNFDTIRKNNMGVEVLKPWDTEVDTSGRQPLTPFDSDEELIEKAIKCFYQIKPFYGECLQIMKNMGHLDLDARKGKAPGGFNYPLYETGIPFIFMNAVGSIRDLITMMHEGGHAIHSFLTRKYKITDFKSIPSEVAELASMSMELISMDTWHIFFEDRPEDLKRAKRYLLEKIVRVLPWVAQIDKFQHWVYLNPKHTIEERTEKWLQLSDEFGSTLIDWNGHKDFKESSWQRQLHLFELPFYYIEYGIAQLGAMAMWRNYKKDPVQGLSNYENVLKLGNTKSVKELYEAGGIEFNFNSDYVNELVEFVKQEYYKI